jgi:hypothetical protein
MLTREFLWTKTSNGWILTAFPSSVIEDSHSKELISLQILFGSLMIFISDTIEPEVFSSSFTGFNAHAIDAMSSLV